MEPNQIRQLLESHGLTEVYHVERFNAYRNNENGIYKLIIEILDLGPDVEPRGLRYGCHVLAEDGTLLVTGNQDATVEEAITFVHWNELDAKLASWERGELS